jgi:uncharacterized protein YbjT (DUF2867 family)
MKLLITGATGNVGRATIAQLPLDRVEVYASVRDIQTARKVFPDERIHLLALDFEQGAVLGRAMSFDSILLIRPPQIAKEEVFRNFLSSVSRETRIVFLSVQGADTKSYLPHAKIEKAIVEMGFPHLFLRPSYFMENLLTTLRPELQEHGRIFLPSGSLPFNWISAWDIGTIAAKGLQGIIAEQAVTLTSSEWHGFASVISMINQECGTSFRYESPGLFRFVITLWRQGKPVSFILVMLLLHFLPRLQKPLPVSSDFVRFTGEEPQGLRDFIEEHREAFY